MKKLLSVMLVAAMLVTACCTFVTMSASAAGGELLDQCGDASAWVTKEGGEGTITVAKEGNAFVFNTTKGWPEASFNFDSKMIKVAPTGFKLHYDFVAEKGTNVMLFFNGKNPMEQDPTGTNSVSLNVLIDSKNLDDKGNVVDLPAGSYTGDIAIEDIAKKIDADADGNIAFSGVKVFAVGGKVTVNSLLVTDGTAPTKDVATTTAAGGATTKAATTTASNAKTGWEDNIALYAVVALGAAAVVTVSVVAGKKAKSK